MRHIYVDFTENEEGFDNPGVSIDPDGDGMACTGPGLCIQTATIEIALTWNQAEKLHAELARFFTPEGDEQ